MNILLVARRFDFGGAENHVCDLANALHQKGHNIFLVARNGRQRGKLFDGIKFQHHFFKDYLLPFHVLWMMFFVLRNRIDLIHAHQGFPIMICSLAAIFLRIKVVATVHGRARLDLRPFFTRIIPCRIIFVSQAVKTHGEKRFNIAQKSVYIPNGVIPMPVPEKPHPHKIFYISKVNNNHFKFLEMMFKGGLSKLIEKYPDIEFHIIGDGCKLDELKTLVKKENSRMGHEYCFASGYQSNLSSLLGSSSLVLGVGRVALEACAVGIPVLSVNSKRISGLVSLDKYHEIKHFNFIDIQAGAPNTENISSEIIRFFDDQQRWLTQSGKIAVEVNEDFGFQKIVSRTEEVYESCFS
jgi:glycosyltransferase involved in cell wall biosynthesis